MAKQFAACNWVPSRITEDKLNEMVSIDTLPKKTEIRWRVPGTENPPTPRQGEVVVFVNHIGRGFKPPGSMSSVKCTYKKNQLLSYSGIFSI